MISTHVLDTSLGRPARGIDVHLEKSDGKFFLSLAQGVTNEDGRLVFDCEKLPGTYRLTFAIEEYLKKNSKEHFFVSAPVVFKIENTDRKYHIPLLLNPFGFSIYRGS